MHLGVEREQGSAGAGHVRRVLEQTVAISVVHCDGGWSALEVRPDIIEDGAHRRSEIGMANGVDKRLELRPERHRVFRCNFDQGFEQTRIAELVFGKHIGAGDFRGQTSLIVVDFSLDANDRTFAAGLEDFESGVVRKDRAAERAGAVAEVHAVKQIAVRGGFRGEFFYDEQAREGTAVGFGAGRFQVADRGKHGRIRHGILRVGYRA